jgi:hypothetical protein
VRKLIRAASAVIAGARDLVAWPFYRVWRRITKMRRAGRPRARIAHFVIQPDAYLEVFWKDVAMGSGPGLSLVIRDEEVLRFDCLGAGGGHFHIEPERGISGSSQYRLRFPERTIEEQVERTIFELRTNLDTYLRHNRNPSVRRATLNPGALNQAIDKARSEMLTISVAEPVDRAG